MDIKRKSGLYLIYTQLSSISKRQVQLIFDVPAATPSGEPCGILIEIKYKEISSMLAPKSFL